MDNKIKFPENVMLIDAAFLNFVTADMKKHFERMLDRPLQQIDLSELITYLALDCGIEEGSNNLQILFVYDKDSSKLFHTAPSDLKQELDGMAFRNAFGEFTFAGIPSEEMVTRADLFLDMLRIVTDSKDVKRLAVLSFNEEYGKQVTELLKKTEDKTIVQFRMNEPEEPVDYQWEFLAYPLMHALGIKGDEL